MATEQYLAEVEPEWQLIYDEPAPIGKSVHLLMEYGGCIKGVWYAECGAIAWRALPKLTAEQKRYIVALKAAGVDLTKHKSKQHGNERLSDSMSADNETGIENRDAQSCVRRSC